MFKKSGYQHIKNVKIAGLIYLTHYNEIILQYQTRSKIELEDTMVYATQVYLSYVICHLAYATALVSLITVIFI